MRRRNCAPLARGAQISYGTRNARNDSMYRTLILVFCTSVSCAHTRPSEMTAAEHRAEASSHEQKAKTHQEQFQPWQTLRIPSRGPFIDSPAEGTTLYNPTAQHLEAADLEMRGAAAHLAAAKTLETFEDVACQEIPRAQRAACPLLASSATEVRLTTYGVQLSLKPTVDATDINRRLNCHLAYANANGFGQPSCPLFVKGVTIRLRGLNLLEFSGNQATGPELHRQARHLFGGEPLSPASHENDLPVSK
jgi:hypothetical protein